LHSGALSDEVSSTFAKDSFGIETATMLNAVNALAFGDRR
jgi:hypothetical protein